MMAPLPASMRRHLGANTHPGLLLDKYAASVGDNGSPADKFTETVQKETITRLVALTRQPPRELDWDDLWQRRQFQLKAVGATDKLRCTTAGPLTLHLARASALENAGICLHPLYGFVYLPGSGLKGLARAYAKTVAGASDDDVQAVFGNEPDEADKDLQRAGAIVFHDAWPLRWPRLVADIVNNHHRDYYAARDGDNDHPPGDWEEPSMVTFLAVPAGVEFEFPLAKRRLDPKDTEGDRLLGLARGWLLGGLVALGVGAKTASGYGYFVSDKVGLPANSLSVQIQLITPAFVGDSDKQARQLRLSTVKSLLRRWWRSFQGHLTVAQLREQEAAVFGSLKTGVQLRIRPANAASRPRILPSSQNMGGGGSPLGYLGFGPIGYDTNTRANLTKFDALDAPQTFDLILMHRSPEGFTAVLRAFWLFSALGGIGSRHRRGWGALQLVTKMEDQTGLPHLSNCRTTEEYRLALDRGLEMLCPQDTRVAAHDLPWAALSRQTRILLSRRTFPTWWEALEDLGNRFQQFRSYDRRGAGPNSSPGPDYHNTKNLLSSSPPQPTTLPERSGFGLPYAQGYRSLRNPDDRKPPTATFTPFWVRNNKREEGRRASPVLFKIVQLAGGEFIWQVAFLPSKFLPDGARVAAERTDLRPATALPGPAGGFTPPETLGVARPGIPEKTLVTDFLDWLNKPVALPGAVFVRILAAHKAGGKDGFRVQEEGRRPGILLHGTPPAQLPKLEETIQVYRSNNDINNPQYRWDPPAPPAPPKKGSGQNRPRR